MSVALDRALQAWATRPNGRTASAHARLHGVSIAQFRRVRLASGEPRLTVPAPYALLDALTSQTHVAMPTPTVNPQPLSTVQPQPKSLIDLTIENERAKHRAMLENL